MQKQLADVKKMIENNYGYTATHMKDDKSGIELLQASISPGEIPFMTFSYNKILDCITINTELQYPDTFTVTEIALNCMRIYDTRMGKAFLVVPIENGKHDVLYGEEAYDYIENKIEEFDSFQEEMANHEEGSQYFTTRETKKNKITDGSGNIH